jgi:hypothetical protein
VKLIVLFATVVTVGGTFLEQVVGATSRKAAVSIPDDVIGIFHRRNTSDRNMVLGVDSTSNRNEYQEYFLGVKAAGAWG